MTIFHYIYFCGLWSYFDKPTYKLGVEYNNYQQKCILLLHRVFLIRKISRYWNTKLCQISGQTCTKFRKLSKLTLKDQMYFAISNRRATVLQMVKRELHPKISNLKLPFFLRFLFLIHFFSRNCIYPPKSKESIQLKLEKIPVELINYKEK